MKMNAFARLIRTIACGFVVLGASDALGQLDLDITDGDTTFGTLQSVDEIGNDIDDAGAEASFTQTQAPAAGDTSGSSSRQIYYPPGTQVPQRETEIPGSAYFTGPDGKRIDPSTLLNQVPAGQERLIPNKDSILLSPSRSFSLEGVYDGTLAFPMGTFPTTPFGERIISQVPAGQSVASEPEASEIQGALLDENGRPVDGATPAMENGVPVDKVVRPGDSPDSDKMKNAQMQVLEANKSGGAQNLKGEVKILRDPVTGRVTLIGDEEDIALVSNGMFDKNPRKNNEEGDSRIEQRLEDALGEKERLSGLLAKANQKAEALTKEVSKLKANRKKQNDKSRSQIAYLTRGLRKMKNESSETDEKLKVAQLNLENMTESLQVAQKAAKEKVEMLQVEAEKNASQAQAKIAAAEADAEKARAELLALTKKMAGDSADVDSADVDVGAIGIEAVGAAEMTAPGEDEIKAVADTSDEMAIKAKEAKAAAELEVSRKLKEMEERKKKADAAKEAAEDAANKDVAGDAAGDKGKMAEGKDDVLSLDDQIKRLKAKRDQQIAESETRIRAKQQREIDKLLEEGKAVDSDDVKSAVDKMKSSIKTSEEKLRSRFLRRLERLKENMKKTLK